MADAETGCRNGVLRLMRVPQVSQMCGVIKAMDEAADPLAAISTLLRVSALCSVSC